MLLLECEDRRQRVDGMTVKGLQHVPNSGSAMSPVQGHYNDAYWPLWIRRRQHAMTPAAAGQPHQAVGCTILLAALHRNEVRTSKQSVSVQITAWTYVGYVVSLRE
jgi:hypothetical protein